MRWLMRVGRAGEDVVDIVGLFLAFVDDVAVEAVEDGRGVAAVSTEQIGGRRQLFPIDGDIFEGVCGDFGCGCDDGRHHFTDMAHALRPRARDGCNVPSA